MLSGGAITGYGQDVDRQRTRDAGFNAHMVKPVDVEDLDSQLRRDLDRNATRRQASDVRHG